MRQTGRLGMPPAQSAAWRPQRASSRGLLCRVSPCMQSTLAGQAGGPEIGVGACQDSHRHSSWTLQRVKAAYYRAIVNMI